MSSVDYLSQLPILPDEKIILSRKTQENLIRAVKKIVEQTDIKEYREWMRDFFSTSSSALPKNITDITKIFVPEIKSPFNKNFASFDFHLSGQNNEEPRLIEHSFFPAGDSFIRGVIPSNFSEKYQKNFLKLLSSYKTIAIVDTKIAKQKRMAEFLWTQEFLKEEGIEVVLADAESIDTIDEKIFVTDYQSGKKISVDYVLNRCTFSDYLKSPQCFTGLREVDKNHPDKISTTYREWLFSEKVSSVYFTQENFFISPKTIFSKLGLTKEKIIKTCGKFFIAKPLFSYASQGIYINPSQEKIEKITSQKLPYLFQEIIPAPTLEDGRKYEIRVFMVHGKISCFFARVYNGELSNYDQPKSGICGVKFR